MRSFRAFSESDLDNSNIPTYSRLGRPKSEDVAMKRWLVLGGLISSVGLCAAWILSNLSYPRTGGTDITGSATHETAVLLGSAGGQRLSDFFTGLPIEPRFSHGQNGYETRVYSTVAQSRGSFITWLGALWGLPEVHAQGQCNLCYQQDGCNICGQDCGGCSTYDTTNGNGQFCNYGSQPGGTSKCDAACTNISPSTTCFNSTCCASGCGSGCSGCGSCLNGICYCGG